MESVASWTVCPGYYAKHLDDHFLHAGVPVLVHSAGVYPELVNAAGESTRDAVAHFRITYTARTTTDGQGARTTTYFGISVTGHHRPDLSRHQTRMTAVIWDMALSEVAEIGPAIEEAKRHLDVNALRAIPAQYAEAEQRIAQAEAYPMALTRVDYEAACRELGVPCLAEEACSGWGDFRYPQYDAETVLSRQLAERRWRGRLEEQAAAPTPEIPEPSIPEPTGQLWEPCEHCGKEPIYMPLHVCLDCWPRQDHR
ncbi:hypothetical protein [Halomonas sp. C05BenzN]|uniref:hypothetical protein n=1 Tax=Halomonas sp. C05BenzN TaxID=3411041 RepID=UPI003B947610